MDNEKDKLENLFRDRFQNEELPVPEGMWERMRPKLPPPPSTTGDTTSGDSASDTTTTITSTPWIKIISAVVVAGFLSTIAIYLVGKKSHSPEIKSVATTNSSVLEKSSTSEKSADLLYPEINEDTEYNGQHTQEESSSVTTDGSSTEEYLSNNEGTNADKYLQSSDNSTSNATQSKNSSNKNSGNVSVNTNNTAIKSSNKHLNKSGSTNNTAANDASNSVKKNGRASTTNMAQNSGNTGRDATNLTNKNGRNSNTTSSVNSTTKSNASVNKNTAKNNSTEKTIASNSTKSVSSNATNTTSGTTNSQNNTSTATNSTEETNASSDQNNLSKTNSIESSTSETNTKNAIDANTTNATNTTSGTTNSQNNTSTATNSTKETNTSSDQNNLLKTNSTESSTSETNTTKAVDTNTTATNTTSQHNTANNNTTAIATSDTAADMPTAKVVDSIAASDSAQTETLAQPDTVTQKEKKKTQWRGKWIVELGSGTSLIAKTNTGLTNPAGTTYDAGKNIPGLSMQLDVFRKLSGNFMVGAGISYQRNVSSYTAGTSRTQTDFYFEDSVYSDTIYYYDTLGNVLGVDTVLMNSDSIQKSRETTFESKATSKIIAERWQVPIQISYQWRSGRVGMYTSLSVICTYYKYKSTFTQSGDDTPIEAPALPASRMTIAIGGSYGVRYFFNQHLFISGRVSYQSSLKALTPKSSFTIHGGLGIEF